MQRFDLSAHYSLLQAFDLTGRRIFSDAWTGTEAWTARADDPKESIAEKATLAQALSDIAGEMAKLSPQINYPENEAQRIAAQNSYVALSKRQSLVEDQLRHFPPNYDGWKSQHGNSMRRSKIEDVLLEAFSHGALQIFYGNGVALPWQDWRHRSAFKVYINLSLVRVPASERSIRGIVQSDRDSTISPANPCREPNRLAAFVQKDEFEQWSRKFRYAPDLSEALTPEEQCRLLLKQWVTDHTGKPSRKQDCWNEFRARLPELSEAAFKRVWATEAPESWRAPGRRA